ncbi:MAG: AAA family ATPase [Candidatus Aminicenantes bacterium]|nr:AAA family ATPase [Candidatus Aminicenantes bacterium]
MPRIRRLEIKGFRAFGSQAQVLEFHGPLAMIWGPNSQGKTSLAEAIEFLLTGKTVRRELIASAKREFAEALRNAHMPSCEDVIVSADIEDTVGQTHRVERKLTRDYTGRDPCYSELRINGDPAFDLSTIGIRLFQPPLEAPVLMPHTLRYVVSAEPQQRTEYFKALLEVSDLEEIRTAISEAKNRLAPPLSPSESILRRCRTHPRYGATFDKLEAGGASLETITEVLSEAVGLILSDAGPVPEGFEARIAATKALLEEQRSRTFPVTALEPRKGPSWTLPEGRFWKPFEDLVQARSSVVQETSRLIRLFEEVIKVPELASAKVPVDCPVCETPKALTPERIAFIRKQLESSAEFRKAREETERALRELRSLADRIRQESQESCPLFFAWNDGERERRSFSHTTMEALLGARSADLLPPWMETSSRLEAALETVRGQASELQESLETAQLDELNEAKLEELRQKIADLAQAAKNFVEALSRYKEASEPLVRALRSEVDRRAGMEGWQELIDLAGRRDELSIWLAKRAAYDQMVGEIDEAIKEIDQAKAKILDEKFDELSQEILRWWNLLRPDESTSFDGIQRGGTGRRFIDLKARLAAEPGGSSGSVLRDAVAVFSDSQLNCFGLSAFLARTVREGTGFIILDDPVPASDDEHRAFFIDRVLEELIGSSIQVILLTHDERMWKDVQERYKHLELDTLLVSLEEPKVGAKVESRSDTLDALLARATPYVKNANPRIRKIGAQRLRDAAERFCKLMLVKHRRDQEDSAAMVSDYDGKTLGDLIPDVYTLLTKDPSHSGKLRVIGQRLSPGSHDHQVPPPGDLKQSLGDLKYLRKEYLP